MKPYKESCTLFEIIEDGWSRNFEVSQTVQEAQQMGFKIDDTTVVRIWMLLDDTMEKFFKENYEW